MKRAIAILRERGQEALEIAKKRISQEEIEFKPLKEALCYFMDDWEDVLHPALVSLACEAVGGNPETTLQIGAAMVLLAGGADVHDDVIDQSTVKESCETVYGKFGKDITILTGDALLFEGLYMLHEACKSLQDNQKHEILNVTKRAFFAVSSAEAKEASLRGKFDLSAGEYLDIIKTKVAVAEATAKIGAIFGNGTPEEIDVLGHYGKTFGILMTVRDEFIDIFHSSELKNRTEKECLPLPVLAAFKDPEKKKKILQLLKSKKIEEKEIAQILDIVIDSKEAQELKKEMVSLIAVETRPLLALKHCRKTLQLLLTATMEDI